MLNFLKITSFLLLITFTGCERKAIQSTNDRNELKPYIVQTETFDQSIEQIATSTPLSEHKITSPIEGYIVTQLKPYGSHVKQGDIIFKLVDEDAADKIFSALEQYLSAEIDLKNLANEVDDNELELKAGLVSQEAFKMKKMDLAKHKTTYLQAKYKLMMICRSHNLDFDTVIKVNQENFDDFIKSGGFARHISLRSTEDGVLLPVALEADKGMSSAAAAGKKVDYGQTIAALGDLHQAIMTIQLNETQLPLVEKKPNITAINPAQPKLKLIANVAQINLFNFNPKADEQTRYPITIQVQSPQPIKPGTRFKLIIHDQPRESLMIPIQAIHDLYKKPYVLMQNQEKRFIQLGKSNRSKVEIISGLKQNETILVPTNHPQS